MTALRVAGFVLQVVVAVALGAVAFYCIVTPTGVLQ